MATKDYLLRFGSGNPQSFTGLAPTFISYINLSTGTSVARPGITEIISGLYRFTTTPSFQIAFIADGATTGLDSAVRFVAGTLDPLDITDTTISNIDTNVSALSSSFNAGIGSTASSFGTDSADPATLFGYLKRVQELLEGDQSFNKTTGSWLMQARSAGQTLRVKTLANGASIVTRS